MTLAQIDILIILLATLILFIWGKYRYDMVAMFALIACVIIGLVDPKEAFLGFGHPATVTVGLVLILSHTLNKSGALDHITALVQPTTAYSFTHIATLSAIAAALSMFMNNVGALALLMPVAIESAQKSGRSPAQVLMPLSFGSILGGLVTMIGTPPNIIIANYREKYAGEPFGMFDFSPVGGVVAIAGVLFVAVIGWRLLKIHHTDQTNTQDIFEIESYVSEVKIPKSSSMVGKTIPEIEEMTQDVDVAIVTLIHKKQRFVVPPRRHTLTASDILLIEGSHEDLDHFITKFSLEIVGAKGEETKLLHSKEAELYEVVIAPGSPLEGKTVEQTRFKRNYGVNFLAVSRQGRPYRGRLKSFSFRGGDVILLLADPELIQNALTRLHCFPLAERGLNLGRKQDSLKALGIFTAAIGLASFGILPIHIAFAAAVGLMVLSHILPIREIYEGIDWPVIVLLGAMIPIGAAVESTGTTGVLASTLLHIASDTSPILLLALVLIITMTLSDILNNAATAILMAPIGKTIAEQLEVNPDSFLMAVAIGASCAFLTPIGHQNNALVMGPGGYKFSDYWRMGLPLEIIITCIAIPMILVVWPL